MGNKPDEKGKSVVMAAIIGAVASIIVALITTMATYYKVNEGFKEKVKEDINTKTESINERIDRLNLVAAGYITIDCKVSRSSGGMSFTPRKGATGEYYIDFVKPFEVEPIVVATAQGGKLGVRTIVQEVTHQSVKIEGREYGGNGLADTPFHFVVVVPNR